MPRLTESDIHISIPSRYTLHSKCEHKGKLFIEVKALQKVILLNKTKVLPISKNKNKHKQFSGFCKGQLTITYIYCHI